VSSLCPVAQIKMVFLSATMSNAREFAEWICHLHHQPCHVVYTTTAPPRCSTSSSPMGAKVLYCVLQ